MKHGYDFKTFYVSLDKKPVIDIQKLQRKKIKVNCYENYQMTKEDSKRIKEGQNNCKTEND